MICFCHIRWDFVYQRPQHLLSRFALYHRVFIVEEPMFGQGENKLEIARDNENPNLCIVRLKVKDQINDPATIPGLKNLLSSLILSEKIKDYYLWYYSPMALAYSDHLHPSLLIYDCMDELSAFKFAPPRLKEMEQLLLSKADIVFTGGHSLYEAKKDLHPNVYAFPSSIDKAHFGKARTKMEDPEDQKNIRHPRFGFYGVIDERFHISLMQELANRKPEWHFILIGPVVKIDPDMLPKANNIHYPGSKSYAELPSYLAGWDIAMLPFELNESTKYISPTKTPEYLAGGKPVISTSIRDVVNPYGKNGLVKIADTAEEFIKAAEDIFNVKDNTTWKDKVDAFLVKNSWNQTWHRMTEIMDSFLAAKESTKFKKTKTKIYV